MKIYGNRKRFVKANALSSCWRCFYMCAVPARGLGNHSGAQESMKAVVELIIRGATKRPLRLWRSRTVF